MPQGYALADELERLMLRHRLIRRRAGKTGDRKLRWLLQQPIFHSYSSAIGKEIVSLARELEKSAKDGGKIQEKRRLLRELDTLIEYELDPIFD